MHFSFVEDIIILYLYLEAHNNFFLLQSTFMRWNVGIDLFDVVPLLEDWIELAVFPTPL